MLIRLGLDLVEMARLITAGKNRLEPLYTNSVLKQKQYVFSFAALLSPRVQPLSPTYLASLTASERQRSLSPTTKNAHNIWMYISFHALLNSLLYFTLFSKVSQKVTLSGHYEWLFHAHHTLPGKVALP